MQKSKLETAVERCDVEITAHKKTTLEDNWTWILGWYDWQKEKEIIMEQFVQDAVRTEPESYDAAMQRLQQLKTIRLLHVGMGLVTEAAEIMDMLKKHIIYGKPLDDAKFVSELGDGSWYQRIGCAVLDHTFTGMIEKNIAELRVRFPDKFTEHHALNRDTAAEMAATQGIPRPGICIQCAEGRHAFCYGDGQHTRCDCECHKTKTADGTMPTTTVLGPSGRSRPAPRKRNDDSMKRRNE